VEVAGRRRGKISKAETAEKQDEISTLLPKKGSPAGPVVDVKLTEERR